MEGCVVDPGRIMDDRDGVAEIGLIREYVDLAERPFHGSSLPWTSPLRGVSLTPR